MSEPTLNEAVAALADANARIAELEQDAARWQLARDLSIADVGKWWHIFLTCEPGQDFTAAIDAELAAEKGGGE